MIKKLLHTAIYASLLFAGNIPYAYSSAVTPTVSTTCCNGCPGADCVGSTNSINNRHNTERNDFKSHVADETEDHREWLVKDMLTTESSFTGGNKPFVETLQDIAERMTVQGLTSVFEIGQFFDAKHYLETQQIIQEKRYEALKNYQPDEGICTFGTVARSLAHTESSGHQTAHLFSRRQMARHLGTKNIGGATREEEDKFNRQIFWRQNLCVSHQNNWIDGINFTGLTAMCGDADGQNDDSSSFPTKYDADINYTQTMELTRTLDVDGPAWIGADAEFATMALGNNLYGNDISSRGIGAVRINNDDLAQSYLKYRSTVAKRGVAENSFNNIIGLKSLGANYKNATNTSLPDSIGRLIQNLGVPEDEVAPYLELYGPDPSYLSTLEILSKKIYQNPQFYTNLYDSPSNLKRKEAAMKGIELMLERAIHESQMRQEMAMSVLLSSKMKKYAEDANKKLNVNE